MMDCTKRALRRDLRRLDHRAASCRYGADKRGYGRLMGKFRRAMIKTVPTGSFTIMLRPQLQRLRDGLGWTQVLRCLMAKRISSMVLTTSPTDLLSSAAPSPTRRRR